MFRINLWNMLCRFLGNETGSIEITTAHIDQFNANVMHLAQQEESVLWEHCTQEEQHSESQFYDRVGLTSMRKKAGRHSDVIVDDIPHSRRMLVTEDTYAADYVDQEDKLRTIMNITNEYAVAIGYAMGREMDTSIITNTLGNAYSGRRGATAVPLTSTQKICAFDGVTLTGVGLNVATLRRTRKKFKTANVMKARRKDKAIFCYAAQQADDLLASTEVTSSDYNTVRTLVDGEIDSFVGFKFVETELIPYTSAATTYDSVNGEIGANGDADGTLPAAEGRRCFAFMPKSAIKAAMPRSIKGRISEIPTKHYSHLVYGGLTFGATRMEEVQVQEVICWEKL